MKAKLPQVLPPILQSWLRREKTLSGAAQDQRTTSISTTTTTGLTETIAVARKIPRKTRRNIRKIRKKTARKSLRRTQRKTASVTGASAALKSTLPRDRIAKKAKRSQEKFSDFTAAPEKSIEKRYYQQGGKRCLL